MKEIVAPWISKLVSCFLLFLSLCLPRPSQSLEEKSLWWGKWQCWCTCVHGKRQCSCTHVHRGGGSAGAPVCMGGGGTVLVHQCAWGGAVLVHLCAWETAVLVHLCARFVKVRGCSWLSFLRCLYLASEMLSHRPETCCLS